MLTDFLAEVSLLTDQDTQKDGDEDKVTMMTVHAAKGLEYKVVFIVGMEEELFPSQFSMESARELEEERRLFYVAITRAEERCFISYARTRFRNGTVNIARPSRFVKDIDAQYLDQPADVPFIQKKSFWDDEDDFAFGNKFAQPRQPQTKSYYPKNDIPDLPPVSSPKKLSKIPVSRGGEVVNTNPSVPVGKTVRHALFGTGKVISVSMTGASEKAEIDFGAKGVKSLLLKFAKLEILD
jgi:DNA helicase-2/ATP-dependent DNA helicase PcrA